MGLGYGRSEVDLYSKEKFIIWHLVRFTIHVRYLQTSYKKIKKNYESSDSILCLLLLLKQLNEHEIQPLLNGFSYGTAP